jgi:dihydrofolate reductase
MISAIVCVDKNWGIGSKGDLLIKIPEDMKFFKNMTANGMVIMGRKTYDSLPIKPLPNRTNIVITSEKNKTPESADTFYISMEFAKMYLSTLPKTACERYIIGGGTIYKELLPYCDTVYVTKVDYAFENVDTYFPNLEQNKEWEMTVNGEEKEYNELKYKFCTYKRRCEL